MIPPMSFYGVPKLERFPYFGETDAASALWLLGARFTRPPNLRQDLVTARYLPFVDYLQLPFEFYLCAVSKESVTDNVTRVLNRVDLMLARYRDSFWLRSILSVGLWPSTRSPIYVEGLRKPALPIYVFPVTYHRVTEQMPDVLRQHYLDNFT